MICTFFKHMATLQGTITYPTNGKLENHLPNCLWSFRGEGTYILYIHIFKYPYMFVCHVHDFCMLPVKFGRPNHQRKPRKPRSLHTLGFCSQNLNSEPPYQRYTLQGINISHLGKRKIIFKYALSGGYVSSLEGIQYSKLISIAMLD